MAYVGSVLVLCAVASLCMLPGLSAELVSPCIMQPWNNCELNPNFLLALKEEPTQFVAKALTREYARNYICSKQTTAAQCNSKKGDGCAWDTTYNVCANPQVRAFSLFKGNPWPSSVPISLTCPYSDAYNWNLCTGLNSAASCNAAPQCKWQANFDGYTCYPSNYAQLHASEPQFAAWITAYSAFSPDVWGRCEATCYVQQFRDVCGSLNKPATGADPCASKYYGSGAWATAVSAMSNYCNHFATNAAACTGWQRNKYTLNAGRMGAYYNWVVSSKEAMSCAGTRKLSAQVY